MRSKRLGATKSHAVSPISIQVRCKQYRRKKHGRSSMEKRRPIFDFHPEAIVEAREAVDWYGKRSAFAASKFKAELRSAEESVTQHPNVWMPYLHGTRCF